MTTLADLRTRLYQRFDSGIAGYVGTAEANSLINEGARHLHNWVASEAEYYIWKESTLQLVQGQSDYPVSPDLQKVLKIFRPASYSITGQTPCWLPMDRIMPEEYTGLNFGAYQGPVPFTARAYLLMGQTLRILPMPQANPGQLLLWYVPKYQDLVNDTDVCEISNDPGWEEFIVNQAAIACRLKEESDTSQLEKRQQEIMQIIQASVINRDMGRHQRVVDVDRWRYW